MTTSLATNAIPALTIVTSLSTLGATMLDRDRDVIQAGVTARAPSPEAWPGKSAACRLYERGRVVKWVRRRG